MANRGRLAFPEVDDLELEIGRYFTRHSPFGLPPVTLKQPKATFQAISAYDVAQYGLTSHSYGLRLDTLPVNGEIVLFPPKESDDDQQAE